MIAGAELSQMRSMQGAVSPQPRLVVAAHEFEAQMMKELLGPMERDEQSLDSSDGENGSGGVLGEFATESLGRALSQQGGLGIAKEILNELAPDRAKGTHESGKVVREEALASLKQ